MSGTFLSLLADRFLGTPLMLEPGKAATIYEVLRTRIGGPDTGGLTIDMDGVEASGFTGARRSDRGENRYARRAQGVAIIAVQGSLVNRGAWIDASSGLTSYEGIGTQIDEAASDPEIHAIILDIDSPGGEATGMFAMAEKIVAARQIKPIVAVVNDVAASAAYGVASAASSIVLTPTSIVGSIGVIMVHMDRTGEMEMKGIKPTIFQAGARKSDGHPFGSISPDARAVLQSRIDVLYGHFTSVVGLGRGAALTAEAARATEAGVFIGEEAINAGLADMIGTFDQVFELLSKERAMDGLTSNSAPTVAALITPPASATAAPPAPASSTPAPVPVAAQPAPEPAAPPSPSAVDPVAAYSARVAAIMDSDAAKASPGAAEQARYLALHQPGIGAADAIAILGARADTVAPTAATPVIPTPEQRAVATPASEIGSDAPAEPNAPPAEAADNYGWGNVVKGMNGAA